MTILTDGRLLLPDGCVEGKALVFDEKIVDILDEAEAAARYPDAQIVSAHGGYISPGLIDVHMHGCGGMDTSDNTEGAIQKMSRMIAGYGVTSWLPTTMTFPLSYLRTTFAQIRQAKAQSEKDALAWGGAQVLGCHMEGPFIDPDHIGAQNPQYLCAPDPGYTEAYQDVIRIVTIAPNIPGGLEFIEKVSRDTNVVCSIGHTGADYDCAMEAFAKGSNHVTHLFNAQTGLHHRRPGVVGAALTSPQVYTEMICDTYHIHPALFEMVARLKEDHLVLITDCMRAGGLPDGKYSLGGQPVYVQGIKCTLENGVIAGSVLHLDQAVRNVKAHTSWPLWKVVRAASLAPARSIGLSSVKGSLEPGKDADVLVTDADFIIQKTYVRGKAIYEKQ